MERSYNLEKKLNVQPRYHFRSEGEQKIATYLEDNSTKYQYESSLLINSNNGKPRIWYPDFYLPEFKTYIEYYGLAGQQNYQKGIQRKESAYSKMGLDVISVYPWMFTEDWKTYIMKELKKSSVRQYRNLMSKPYWSKDRFKSHNNAGYHRRKTHLY